MIVIIGILAAISIPIFLHQREKAEDATAKSDLRDLAANEESYLVSNQAYGTLAELVASGASITRSSQVTLRVVWYTRENGYCLEATHSASGDSFFWDSRAGGLQPAAVGGCPVVTSGTPGDSLP